MYVSETCECCRLMYAVDNMHDEFICKYCKEDADLDEVVNDFRKVATRFTRYIPEAVRREVFERHEHICQYCLLNVADSIDHILPYSFLPDHSPDNLTASCMRCNAIAGSKMFPTIHEKRLYIIRRLVKKRTKIPVWTQAEVDDLEGTLKTCRKIVVSSERERQQMMEYIRSIGLEPS